MVKKLLDCSFNRTSGCPMGILEENPDVVFLGIVIAARSRANSLFVIKPAIIGNASNAVSLYLTEACLSVAKWALPASAAVDAQSPDQAA